MKKTYFLLLPFLFTFITLIYADHAHNDGVNPRHIDPSKDKEYKLYNNGPRNTMGLGYVRPPGETDQQTEERLLKEATKGNIKSQYELGCFYYYQDSQDQYKKAFKWFTIAADQGLDTAQYYVGLCYENGQGVQQNDKEAFLSYISSAKQDNANAEYKVGVCYQKGFGIKQNMEIAVHWWNISASKGNADAQNDLGNSYLSGQGVNQDYDQAFNWLSKAAEQNNANAQNNLGECYYHGNGIKADTEKAYEWWLIAYQNDCPDALANIEIAEKVLSLKQISKIKADAQVWLFKHSSETKN